MCFVISWGHQVNSGEPISTHGEYCLKARWLLGAGKDVLTVLKVMAKEKDKEDRPIVSMKGEEREEVWDEAYAKEEGIILEFDSESNTGKIKSLLDDSIYSIDSRELLRTKIELRAGDKVFFAPFEDPDGNDYARVIRIIELNT